jgi:DNA-directed RNA polymerase specialized sigma subunit
MNELQDKKDAIVINLFLTTTDNTVKNIAKISGLLEVTVHQIINKYIKTLKIDEKF